MSYLRYIRLYTNDNNNYGRISKRGRKNNYWLNKVKINDKLDIFDGNDDGDKCWHIGTILKLEKQYNDKNKYIKILIHYDGWPSKFDEWVEIDCSKTTSTKLKKLHTFTPYHHYLIDPLIDECQWFSHESKWLKCDICTKKCCKSCFIVKCYKTEKFHCKQCMDLIDYKQIFNAIYCQISDQYLIDINIIYLIADYSMGYIITCSNKQKPCSNKVYFHSRFSLEINVSLQRYSEPKRKTYQYCPKSKTHGTIKLCAKNRRIFCELCTKNELYDCYLCYEFKELKNENAPRPTDGYTVCHNHSSFIPKGYKHHISPCTICKQEVAKYVLLRCSCCGNKYCKQCKSLLYKNQCENCNPKMCVGCNDFVYDKKSYQCNRCNSTVCDECKEYYGWNGGKTLKECGNCDVKRNCESNEKVTIVDGNALWQKEEDVTYGNCNEWLMDYTMRKSKYCRRNKSDRLLEKRWKNKRYIWKRKDRVCNMKENRRFFKRYALTLQY